MTKTDENLFAPSLELLRKCLFNICPLYQHPLLKILRKSDLPLL